MTLITIEVVELSDGSEVVRLTLDDGTVLEADANGISRGNRMAPWDVVVEAFDEDARTLRA